MILFPVITWISLACLFYKRQKGRLRESLCIALLLCFAFIALTTELASLFHTLNASFVTLAWLALGTLSLGWLARCHGRAGFQRPLQHSRQQWRNLTRLERRLVVVIGFIGLLTLLTGLFAPPNNWDSMTYHMTRVSHWIQQGYVGFYPTAIARQNYQMPLAEFGILHFQVLTGSDRFANAVQWSTWCGCILWVSLIARSWGASRRCQLYAALLAATLPMGILQASSTQNDVVTAFFCLGLAYYLIRHQQTQQFYFVGLAGLSMALACLTKGTAYIYTAAILSVWGIRGLWTSSKQSILRHLGACLVIVVIALVFNVGHLSRNHRLYGHPFTTIKKYHNEAMSPVLLTANLMRNLGLHLGLPIRDLNPYTEHLFSAVLGDQLNNPQTTFLDTQFAIPSSRHEDSAGNLPHLLLFGLALCGLPFIKHHRKTELVAYTAMLFLAALFFAAILKWQPWASRLHTPLFMLALPLTAIVFDARPRWSERRWHTLGIILFVYSLPFLFVNKARPLVPYKGHWILTDPRQQQYFANNPDLYPDYVTVAQHLQKLNPGRVGLLLRGDDWEYPLWVLTQRHARTGSPHFQHIGVTDISQALIRETTSPPNLVIATLPDQELVAPWNSYACILETPSLRLLKAP